jgi:serine/threonine-protein kinase
VQYTTLSLNHETLVADPLVPTSNADFEQHVRRVLSSQYEVAEEVGRGGMGIVYRARDMRLKRLVAIKILPPELAFSGSIRSRFLREAETAAQLSHPNIVPIHSVDEREGLVYFVMGFVDGENLGRRLTVRGRLSATETRRVLREVADALAYAHGRRVIHRDIKPDNILLDRETGRSMVTDFGIARAVTEGDSRLTATGVAIGTPAYMSPEQCAGEREIDGRSDLYSLGVVGYQMLAGEVPFVASNTPSMFMKHITERPAPITSRRADVPDDLARIVMTLLAKEPEGRFRDGASLVTALTTGVVPVFASATMPARDDRGSVSSSGTRNRSAYMRGGFGRDTYDVAERDRYGGEIDRAPVDRPQPFDWTTRAGRRAAREYDRNMRRAEKARRKYEGVPSRPMSERIHSFRWELFSSMATILFLFGINAATSPRFYWAIFPTLGIGFGLMKKAGRLFADGARLRDVIGGTPGGAHELADPQGGQRAQIPAPDAAARLVPPGVLDGAQGATVRQAVADRASIQDIMARLGDADRGLLPDVLPTADALVERIAAVATTLHRLDDEMGTHRAEQVEARIAATEKEAETAPDRERRLALLRRQRESLRELAGSRGELVGQLESASLLLQGMALDLLKLRSAGVQSVLDDVQHATQEARALTRQIGHVLEAADELRSLEGGGGGARA